MRVRENLCNGCPECVHCGRNREWTIITYCDVCSEEVDKDKIYIYKGKLLCRECMEEIMEENDLDHDIEYYR